MSKIQRKTSFIFAGTAAAGPGGVAQFGSLANGTPVFSLDPSVIQGLPQWHSGWLSALVGGASPALEDVNAVDYTNSYQATYLLQEGIAEWDGGTTYFINSIVQDVSTGLLYQSVTDNNLNNAVTDSTNWKNISASGPGSGSGTNLLRNSSFAVAQRGGFGTAPATGVSPILDGWKLNVTGGSCDWSQYTDANITGVQLTPHAGNNEVDLIQRIESFIVIADSNAAQTMTFQAKILNLSGGSISPGPSLVIKTANSPDNWSSSTVIVNQSLQSLGNLQVTTVSYTFSVEHAALINGIEVNLDFAGHIGTTGSVVVGSPCLSNTGQLPVGLNNNPPMPDIPPIETALCQRYYQRWGGEASNVLIALGKNTSGTVAQFMLPFQTEMRIIPTLSFANIGNIEVQPITDPPEALTSLALVDAGTRSGGLSATVASGLTAEHVVFLETTNANAYIELSAEL